MIMLYRPVAIESAEQAEALPVGAVLIRHREDETTRVATRIHRGPSPDHVWRTGDGFHRHSGVVGMKALVPIEAEEETSVHVGPGNPYAEASVDSDGNVWFGSGIFTVDVTEKFNEWASKNQRTRLVTPWELADYPCPTICALDGEAS